MKMTHVCTSGRKQSTSLTASHLIAFMTHVLEQAERIVNKLCDQAKEEGLYG